MPFSEITDGPKIPDSTPLARMQGADFHRPRGASPEHLAGISDMFRKITSPKIKELFTTGVEILIQEAKRGENPEVMARQLSELLAAVANKIHNLTDTDYINALTSLQELIKEETPNQKYVN